MKYSFLFASALLPAVLLGAGSIVHPENIRIQDQCIVPGGKTVTLLTDDFSRETGGWLPPENYKENVKFERKTYNGKTAMTVRNSRGKWADTGWELRTKPVPLRDPDTYLIEFSVSSNTETRGFSPYGKSFNNRIAFFDENGKLIGERRIRYGAGKTDYMPAVFTGKYPKGAKSLALQFGGNQPHLKAKDIVAFTDIRILSTERQPEKGAVCRFESGILPVQGKWLTWTGDADIRFQFASSVTTDFSGKKFQGPDGTEKTFFGKNINLPIPADAQFMKYRVTFTKGSLKSITAAGNIHTQWNFFPDRKGPSVQTIPLRPNADPAAGFRFCVSDPSGVLNASLRVTLDGKDVTKKALIHGQIVSVDEKLTDALHTVKIHVSDSVGNVTEKTLFYVGTPRKGPKNTLREDGLVLIDGKPFFPIGSYGVRINQDRKDIDAILRELKEAGFNAVQTYNSKESQNVAGFVKTAEKYGMKVWVPGEGSSNDSDPEQIAKSLYRLRNNPALLAWYTGDDTPLYNTPEQLLDREEIVNSIADGVLTSQAAGMLNVAGQSRWREFLKCTTIYLPEIYPVHHDGVRDHDECVPIVIRDMEAAKKDKALPGAGPRSVWPIIQYFKGWGNWNRIPTEQELRAMTYAAIIHGANGITWYTYTGWGKNIGFSNDPEMFKVMKKLSRELSSLMPYLVQKDDLTQYKGTRLSGPEKNALQQDSLSFLTRSANGKTALFALNSSRKVQKVRFSVPGAKSVKVLSENRTLPVKNETFEDTFQGYDVHVYEITK